MARSTLEEYGFPAVEFKITGCPSRHSLRIIHLTRALVRGRLRSFFRDMKVVTHRIQRAMRAASFTGGFGQEKRRRGRPAHHQNGPRIFRAKLRHQRIWVPELKNLCASAYCPWS